MVGAPVELTAPASVSSFACLETFAPLITAHTAKIFDQLLRKRRKKKLKNARGWTNIENLQLIPGYGNQKSACKLSKWPENDPTSGTQLRYQHQHLIVHVRWVVAVTTLDPLKDQVPSISGEKMGFSHAGHLSPRMGSWLQ